jgi:hypothetical protein
MEEEIYWEEEAKPADTFERDAYKELKLFLGQHLLTVYYGRQLEVKFEKKYFHWITNRVLRQLVSEKFILTESKNLKWGGNVNLYWHKSNRYFKREANKVINLIERYSVDKIGSSIGMSENFVETLFRTSPTIVPRLSLLVSFVPRVRSQPSLRSVAA